MLSKKHSLSTTEVNQVLKRKKFLNFSPFFCYYLASNADFSQIAVAVSKKIKNKPQKNKIKRQIKVLVMPFLFQITPKKIVFIIKAKWFVFTFKEISTFVKNCFLKLEKESQ